MRYLLIGIMALMMMSCGDTDTYTCKDGSMNINTVRYDETVLINIEPHPIGECEIVVYGDKDIKTFTTTREEEHIAVDTELYNKIGIVTCDVYENEVLFENINLN